MNPAMMRRYDNKRDVINRTIDDMVMGFLYYDRKEDLQLRPGDIEQAIERADISVNEIVERFRHELESSID